MMTICLAVLALSALTGGLLAAPGDAPTGEVAARSASAQDAATAWLGLVDAARWNESWAATGQSFKALNSSETWGSVSQKVRVPLGAVVTRRFVGQEWVPAPPYGYQIVRFKTHFASRPDTTETLSLMRENEEWRVVGYTIG